MIIKRICDFPHLIEETDKKYQRFVHIQTLLTPTPKNDCSGIDVSYLPGNGNLKGFFENFTQKLAIAIVLLESKRRKKMDNVELIILKEKMIEKLKLYSQNQSRFIKTTLVHYSLKKWGYIDYKQSNIIFSELIFEVERCLGIEYRDV